MTGNVICIGSALWDVIGRSGSHMRAGSDVPGRIAELPGGVALNIAKALARTGARPILLSAIGQDPAGDALIAACDRIGIDTAHLYRSADLPTDRYMAIEGANGLIAAIADAHSLEAAGKRILEPLIQGPLGTTAAPFGGTVALDGNLTQDLLEKIATGPAFARADLRIAPASPGKAARLQPFLTHGRGTLYVNLEEAGLLCQTRFADTEAASHALHARGVPRVLVTNGAAPASLTDASGTFSAEPPEVLVTRVTGAGDAFMAAHIAAEIAGDAPEAALTRALDAAAAHVSGETAP